MLPKANRWTFATGCLLACIALLLLLRGPATSPAKPYNMITIEGRTYEIPTEVPPSLAFYVPHDVHIALKRKCFICHGGQETLGGFDFKEMKYRPTKKADWQPMDLVGVTRLKLAILPMGGKPARMPKKKGSSFNPLTDEETNAVAGWTDNPYLDSHHEFFEVTTSESPENVQ